MFLYIHNVCVTGEHTIGESHNNIDESTESFSIGYVDNEATDESDVEQNDLPTFRADIFGEGGDENTDIEDNDSNLPIQESEIKTTSGIYEYIHFNIVALDA
jgi:hypothetical protein